MFLTVYRRAAKRPVWSDAFFEGHDFAPATRRALTFDLRKFAAWFVQANNEALDLTRVTVRDITDFREHLRRDRAQAVASINRAIVSLRKWMQWLVGQGVIPVNPGAAVKELRRVALIPKGLERHEVRRLLREVELRGDLRAGAIFHVLLYTGARVSDVAQLELEDLMLRERAGTVVYRYGKGGKQRSCPLPLNARRAMQAYLETRPPVDSRRVFAGERGPLTDKGIRALCNKYSALCGIKLHPHLFRHTFSHQYLADSGNDLVGLAQVCGWENLNTASRYTQRTAAQLAETVERVVY